ncbi:hypothetical protein ACTD5D_33680 [Nocardia takedensis]|uniref:hypothetical protein n=1 Tax=Nocardia takedensis TaxID=259390 RepID=UPI003F759CB4
MSPRPVTYREFAHAVRRYHQDRLLEKVARVSAGLDEMNPATLEARRRSPVRQFALSMIARTALAEGMIHRADVPVDDRQLVGLCVLAGNADHPDIPAVGVLASAGMRRMVYRLQTQQQQFTNNGLEDIARSLGLFVFGEPGITGLPTAEDWERVLGVPLPVYMQIVFVLHAIAAMDRGWISEEALELADSLSAFPSADLDVVHKIIRDHLVIDDAELQRRAKDGEREGTEMWADNPLLATPLIRRTGGFLVPNSPHLMDKIKPRGLYFTGMFAFVSDKPSRSRYLGAIGASLEAHVGKTLRLLEPSGAIVYSEITYGPESERKKTVDYLVVLNDLVLLVEVKSAHADASARRGDDSGLKKLIKESIQVGRDQIDVTASAIRDRVPELLCIPDNREIRGLVVTLDNIPSIDTYLFDGMLQANEVESSTVSAHDLEWMIATLAAQKVDAGTQLLAALTFDDPTPPGLGRAVAGLTPVNNPVSEDYWDLWQETYPIPKPL